MAEVIVSSLLLKLSDAVFQEAVTLYGVKNKVESVTRELKRIRCFLKDADSKLKQKGDDRDKNWVKEVREVSFMIEDAIDTFLFEVQSRSLNKQGTSNILKRMGKKSMTLYSMHKLDKEIKKIQDRLKEITESRARYDIKDLEGRAGGTTRSINRPPVIPDIEEIDLIGFDAEKNRIIELLLDQTVSRLSVVSIVGIGGLGKTTLAEKVYQSAKVKSHFDVHVWLPVSQEFKPTSLLKKILEKSKNINLRENEKILEKSKNINFRENEKIQENEYDEEYYITEVNKTLKEKKYLIVLDDIWADDLWTRIKIALPNINNGSRVLITSRFVDIAKAADPESVPCELRLLTKEESLDLLFKKAFVQENSHELLVVAKKFLKKCGGLPLALVVIGGLLSTKDKTLSAWNKVINTMDWHVDANKCTEILASSYDDLAVHLKTCFIYFASFPEDFELRAELIIRLWIAEGFIPNDAPGTMEEIAEKYLEELAQRSMIQVSKRSADGSIKHFRIHDLLLDLAIREAKEKDFLNVFSKQDDFSTYNVARRATFQLDTSSWMGTSFDEKKLIKYTNPKIRSLFFFGKVIPFNSQFKLLRVFVIFNHDYEDFHVAPHWWNTLNGLIHLRCLIFIKCWLLGFNLHINHFPNLQTLELTNCLIGITGSLWGINTLRHVSLTVYKFMDVVSTVHMPSLQTFSTTLPPKSLAPKQVELLNLPNLRKLDLEVKENDTWEPIIILLAKPDCLLSLKLISSGIAGSIPLEIVDTRALPSYHHLQKLHLSGYWPKGVVIATNIFPPHLIKLTLKGSLLTGTVMSIIQKLENLKNLKLYEDAYIEKQMIFSAGGFPHLEKLKIHQLNCLTEWKIEEGSMPMLNFLQISNCDYLYIPPDLQNTRALKVLRLLFMKGVFIERVENEDKHKFEHIPSITIKRAYPIDYTLL